MTLKFGIHAMNDLEWDDDALIDIDSFWVNMGVCKMIPLIIEDYD